MMDVLIMLNLKSFQHSASFAVVFMLHVLFLTLDVVCYVIVVASSDVALPSKTKFVFQVIMSTLFYNCIFFCVWIQVKHIFQSYLIHIMLYNCPSFTFHIFRLKKTLINKKIHCHLRQTDMACCHCMMSLHTLFKFILISVDQP